MDRSEKPLLAAWAEKETDRRALIRGLNHINLGVSKCMAGRIKHMIEYIAFGCTSDGRESKVRQSTMAEALDVSRQTVNAWVSVCKRLGLIRVEQRFDANGFRKSNEMLIVWEQIREFCGPQKLDNVVKKLDSGCQKTRQPLSKNLTAVSTYTNPTDYLTSKITHAEMSQKENVSKSVDEYRNEIASSLLSADCKDSEQAKLFARLKAEFKLQWPPERDAAKQLSEHFANGTWDGNWEWVKYAIRETHKRDEREPLGGGFNKLNYFERLLDRVYEEKVCR